MLRFCCAFFSGLAAALLIGCGPGAQPAIAPATASIPPRDQLRRLVEHFWEEHTAQMPGLSPQSRADALGIERRYLSAVTDIPRGGLDAASQLTYDIFRRQRELAVEGFTFAAELVPINPFSGVPQAFAERAAETSQHPLASSADLDSWLRQMDAYEQWTQQAIINMRDGVRRGYTSPRALVERMLPTLRRLGDDVPDNAFYLPLRSLPESMAPLERQRAAKSLADAISQRLLPANRRLYDYLRDVYLSHARTGLGLLDLPLGRSWYAYRIKRATGSALQPLQINQIGRGEVERLRAKILSLGEQAGASAGTPTGLPTGGSPNVSPSGADKLAIGTAMKAYSRLGAEVIAAMPALFGEATIAPFEIRAAQFLMAPGSPLIYQPAAANARSVAVLYVQQWSGAAQAGALIVPSYLQQALPGRHYQAAVAQGRFDLPAFRRYDDEPAFVEGWGLYAVSLGSELGIYRSDADPSTELEVQMRCAAALVVDTGLHGLGWTRLQAVGYLRTQAGVGPVEAEELVDGYAAAPGDALACKMGEVKFQALRLRARQSLGERFDLRTFHAEILKEGAMPLDILEARMTLWIEAQRAGAASP